MDGKTAGGGAGVPGEELRCWETLVGERAIVIYAIVL